MMMLLLLLRRRRLLRLRLMMMMMVMRRLLLLLLLLLLRWRWRRWLLLRLMLMLLDRDRRSTVMTGVREGYREGSVGIVGPAMGRAVAAAMRHCVRGRYIAVQARRLTINGRSTLAGDKFCHHNLSS